MLKDFRDSAIQGDSTHPAHGAIIGAAIDALVDIATQPAVGLVLVSPDVSNPFVVSNNPNSVAVTSSRQR